MEEEDVDSLVHEESDQWARMGAASAQSQSGMVSEATMAMMAEVK